MNDEQHNDQHGKPDPSFGNLALYGCSVVFLAFVIGFIIITTAYSGH
ncbi:hypothetical protein LLG46_08005 [bacterium]|nr:hypothetical protein [bacterium]